MGITKINLCYQGNIDRQNTRRFSKNTHLYLIKQWIDMKTIIITRLKMDSNRCKSKLISGNKKTINPTKHSNQTKTDRIWCTIKSTTNV